MGLSLWLAKRIGRVYLLNTKTEGKPSAGIKGVARRVGALKLINYRLSVIRYAPGSSKETFSSMDRQIISPVFDHLALPYIQCRYE